MTAIELMHSVRVKHVLMNLRFWRIGEECLIFLLQKKILLEKGSTSSYSSFFLLILR